MIKEKLKIEAEEWRSNYLGKNYGSLSIGIGALTDAYFAGAEPREKRIKELESQIWKMKCCANCENYCQRIDNRCNTKCKNHNLWKLNEDFEWRTESN